MTKIIDLNSITDELIAQFEKDHPSHAKIFATTDFVRRGLGVEDVCGVYVDSDRIVVGVTGNVGVNVLRDMIETSIYNDGTTYVFSSISDGDGELVVEFIPVK